MESSFILLRVVRAAELLVSGLLKSFGWGIAALHRLHAATKLPSPRRPPHRICWSRGRHPASMAGIASGSRRLFLVAGMRLEATRGGLETLVVSCGSDSSNPASSTAESDANPTSSIRCEDERPASSRSWSEMWPLRTVRPWFPERPCLNRNGSSYPLPQRKSATYRALHCRFTG